MTKSKTKSKTFTAIAALTLAATLTAFSGQAQAHSHWGHRGWGLGAGIVAGALIGTAVASNAYYAPGYTECHHIGRYDRWGNFYRVRVCDVVPY